MKAIFLPEYNSNIIRAMKSLQVRETQIPKPSGDEVLIRVSAAPCNPSDIAFMRGGYNIQKPVPAVMGFECTGTVVESGPGSNAKILLGKRVSCFGRETDNGTWAEYFLTSSGNCLQVSYELTDEQAATFCINPFTAYALFQLALENNAKAIIQNGASGQVGIYIRALAELHGLKVINLVRKEEHVQLINREGDKYVLNLSEADAADHLRDLAHSLHATMAFEAVGGDSSGMILNSMPPGSDMIIYGGLSGKPVGQIDTLDIIFKRKTIRGFNLGDWKIDTGEKRFLEISAEIQELMAKGVLFARIQGSFTLDDVQKALEQYIRNMSAGKILFKP